MENKLMYLHAKHLFFPILFLCFCFHLSLSPDLTRRSLPVFVKNAGAGREDPDAEHQIQKRFIPQNKITTTLEKNAQREKLNSTKNSGGNLGNNESKQRG